MSSRLASSAAVQSVRNVARTHALPCPSAPLAALSTSSSSPSSSSASAAARPAKVPSRLAILSTYRLLRRSIFQTFFTASQYASFNELGDSTALEGRSPSAAWRKEHLSKKENEEHVAFANHRGPQWIQLIKQAYAENAHETDPVKIIRLHKQAEELSQLLIYNMEHSRYLLEGGWGIRRNKAAQLTNVAKKVGLGMPKEAAPLVHEPAGNKHKKARDEKMNQHNKFTK